MESLLAFINSPVAIAIFLMGAILIFLGSGGQITEHFKITNKMGQRIILAFGVVFVVVGIFVLREEFSIHTANIYSKNETAEVSPPVEVTRIVSETVEVQVTQIVTQPVEVTQIVSETVEVQVTQIVTQPVEVTRIVSETVEVQVTQIITQPVEVTQIVPETVEVQVTQIVTQPVEVTRVVEVAPKRTNAPIAINSRLDWQPTGIVVEAGDSVTIKSVGGMWSINRQLLKESEKSGITEDRQNWQAYLYIGAENRGDNLGTICSQRPIPCPLQSAAPNALIGRIGLEGEFFYVGSERSFSVFCFHKRGNLS